MGPKCQAKAISSLSYYTARQRGDLDWGLFTMAEASTAGVTYLDPEKGGSLVGAKLVPKPQIGMTPFS